MNKLTPEQIKTQVNVTGGNGVTAELKGQP
jgi:hypothetical protein